MGLANLAATIASLAGLPDAPFPGRSLLAAPNEAAGATVPLLSELGGSGAARGPAKKGWFKSLIRDRWHYILGENGTEELFDLAADTGERTNLVGSVRGRDVARTMRDDLEWILRESPRNRAGPPSLASE